MKLTHLFASLATALIFSFGQGQPAPEPAPLEVGDAAPLFRLNDHTGQTNAIGGKQKFWTVLAFYPKALTPG